MFNVPEKYRIITGSMGSTKGYGNNGAFLVKTLKLKRSLTVIASDELGWEHVSVSLADRCPTWEEMSFIKSLFWDDADLVVQLHPPTDQHINNHNYCLHLWRKADSNDFCELPPSAMVGYQSIPTTNRRAG